MSWSRRAFAAACTLALAALGAGVFSSWDRMLAGLTQPPAPRSQVQAVLPPPTTGDGALAEARRLLDAGNPSAALAALDRVGPQEPSYPFARQLREQAARSLGESGPSASRGVRH